MYICIYISSNAIWMHIDRRWREHDQVRSHALHPIQPSGRKHNGQSETHRHVKPQSMCYMYIYTPKERKQSTVSRNLYTHRNVKTKSIWYMYIYKPSGRKHNGQSEFLYTDTVKVPRYRYLDRCLDRYLDIQIHRYIDICISIYLSESLSIFYRSIYRSIYR